MKPRWKSVWITPAASGAVAPTGIVQARVSFGPAVRKVVSPRARNPARAGQPSPGRPPGPPPLGDSGQLRLVLRVKKAPLGRRHQRREPGLQCLVGQFRL